MRTIVSTIAKNEEKFVERWTKAAIDADLLVITDTGSTDETVTLARDCGVSVHEAIVRPWRFDQARNVGLALLPDWDDAFVITVDMDEVLTEGWRDKLQDAVDGFPHVKRFKYHYTWSWVEEGIVPDIKFDGNRCHARAGYRWVGPVHEVVTWAGEGEEGDVIHAGFGIEHYADHEKSRSSYLPLLQLAVQEEPRNPRQAFYLGREFYFAGRWNEGRDELMRFLKMPEANWGPERAAAWRLIAKMDHHPERWLLKAIAEDPGRRETWVDLADFYAHEDQLFEAAGAAARALRITHRPGDYLSEAHAWDDEYLVKLVYATQHRERGEGQ
jgi:glycosyltransferase involved in cell wall biosynthesis